MNEIVLKIPRRKHKIQVVHSEELIKQEFERKSKAVEDRLKHEKLEQERLIELRALEEERLRMEQEAALQALREEEAKKKLPKRTIFTEVVTISDSNQPVEISLGNIPEPSITIDEAAERIQGAYDKGFADGQSSVQTVLEAEIQTQVQWIRNIDKIIAKLYTKFSGEITKLEQTIVPLSIMIAKHIIETEIDANSNIVIEQVKRALAELDEDEVFKVLINPLDVDILKHSKSALFGNDSRFRNVDIIGDTAIEQGSCVLVTSAGTIDARLSVQLDRMKTALAEKFKSIHRPDEKLLVEEYGKKHNTDESIDDLAEL